MLVNKVYTLTNNNSQYQFNEANVFRPIYFKIQFEEFNTSSTIITKLDNFAKTYLSIVGVSKVSDLSQLSTNFTKVILPLLVKSIALPDITNEINNSIDFGIWKSNMIVPKRTFDTINVSFQEIIGMTVKMYFIKWMVDYIINPWYGYRVKPDEYKVNMSVYVYDNNSTPTQNYTIKFYGMFPTSAGEMKLAYDNSEVLTTEVTFQYDYWEIIPNTNT